jgi:putative phage-type endonuclease
MKIHDIPQRSPEWFALRLRLITASEVGMFVVNDDKKSMTARTNLIDGKVGKIADGDDSPPEYEDFWMKRGTRLEPDSMAAFEERTGQQVYPVGLVEHDTLCLGCSPDGMIRGATHGVEGKAPCGKVQIARLRANVLPAEYKCQIHHSMIVCEAEYWDFWSWHPRLPAFYVRTYRDQFTADFERGLRDLCAEFEATKHKFPYLFEA